MGKAKKKTPPAKPVEEIETDESAAESVVDEEPYDSMVENGTSDESDDGVDTEEDEDEDDDDDDDEEESDDGFSDKEEESSPPPGVGKRKQSAAENGVTPKKYKSDQNSELFKQPTVAELNHLNETKNLFHSNLFRMQVEETLRELKIKDKHKKFLNTWLESFTAFVKKLKSDKVKMDVDNLPWLKSSGIQLPLDLKAIIIQKGVQFQFIKPTEDPYFMGSFKHESLMGSKMVVDVCVTMPAECFQKEDYLNLVYDQKRALYLSFLAMKMREGREFEYKFAYFNNNPLKPVLELSPVGKMGNKLTLRVFVAGAESSFKLSRFVPWNSNIRGTIFGEKNAKDQLPLATPNYNANVLFDLTMKRNQQMFEQTLTANKSLREGLILLKVWLKQRNLNVGYTGFGNHIMSAFVVYLFKQRKLNAAMSSYQVARHVWNHLAVSAWDEDGKGISLCSDAGVANQPSLEQFSTHFNVVFVDATGFCNICANLSVDLYRRIKNEAKRAVDILNNMKVNSFQLIFMESCPVYTQFDHIFKFSGDAAINKMLKMYGDQADRHNFVGFWFPQVLKMVSKTLRQGLTDRIYHLSPIENASTPWELDSPPVEVEKTFRLGIILNPERAYEILDKGPQANEDTAESFRKFWGDKSELRRFQDGSITEACVWAATGESFAQKRLIVQRIVLHLLKHHFGLDEKQIRYIAGELDVAYKLNRIFKVDKLLTDVNQETDAETTALEVIKSFDDLGQKLRTLDDLPLDISAIQGTSPVFRYADPVPILPDGKATKSSLVSRAVSYGVIQLGVSGKWPNDLIALRALKTAFYIKISEALREKYKFRTLLRFDGVFVFKDGFVFQVEIAHPKEIGLLKKEVTDKGITQYRDTPESIALEKRHVLLPKMTSALHGLHQLHPGLGPTIMIAKRWLYSQLIDDGLWPDECTELLIASQFMKMGAQANACQPQTGFFRFLHLLANTDWRTELTILNFNEEMDEETKSELENRYNNERDTFPPLFIVTSYDEKRYGIWSQEAPITPVLARVVLLAKHTLSLIELNVFNPLAIMKPSKLFTASPEGYDVLIRLKTDYTPNCMANEFPSGFSDWDQPNFRQFPAGQNLLKSAITDLRDGFSEFCIFFYNPCGGREIAVIWKPDVFAEREFKVTALNGCSLTGNGTSVVCNKDALIEDFKIVLKGMFVSIEEMNK